VEASILSLELDQLFDDVDGFSVRRALLHVTKPKVLQKQVCQTFVIQIAEYALVSNLSSFTRLLGD
jgi:hypothetical protein